MRHGPFLIFACLLLAGCAAPDAPDAALELATDAPVDEDVRPDQRGHVHDYWAGDTQRTLMDAGVPVTMAHNHLFDEPPREQHAHGCEEELVSSSQGGSVKFGLPEGETVLPGTERLTVAVSWSDPAVSGLRVRYSPAAHRHDDGHAHGEDFMDAGRVTNGGEALISVSPGMTDAGHQVRSHWAFFLCADSDEPLSVAEGTIRVTITAHRAQVLSVDPPHPDPWGERTRLALGNWSWSGTSVSALNKGDGAWLELPLEEGAIVPWPARSVRVTVRLDTTPHAPATADGVLLYWKDASEADWVFEATTGEETDAGLVFEVPVEEADQWDGAYATRSDWSLWLRLGSEVRTRVPFGAGTWSAPHATEGNLHATAEGVHYED